MLSTGPAGADDLERVLELAAARRAEYAGYQPRFWRPAVDAVERHRTYLGGLLDDDATLVLVAREDGAVRGFVVARLVPAPPVHDPGGPTCAVDDFAVDQPAAWPRVGTALLDAVRGWARVRGAVQLVVVTAQRDEGERALLATAGLAVASEWWVGAVDGGDPR